MTDAPMFGSTGARMLDLAAGGRCGQSHTQRVCWSAFQQAFCRLYLSIRCLCLFVYACFL